jgi:hypothetical protein
MPPERPHSSCSRPEWVRSEANAIKECSPAELLDDPMVGLVNDQRWRRSSNSQASRSRQLVGRFHQALAPNAHIGAL